MNRKQIESLMSEQGIDDYKWIDPENIVVSQWVRIKCRFGCKEYGNCVACPPNVPSIPECERLFSEFSEVLLFHFKNTLEDPDGRHNWTKEINARLFDIERSVFLSGYHKAFVIYIDPCNICKECVTEISECRHPQKSRPSMEGLAVDVFTTVRKCGYDIQVLSDYDQEMNRFGMLLIE